MVVLLMSFSGFRLKGSSPSCSWLTMEFFQSLVLIYLLQFIPCFNGADLCNPSDHASLVSFKSKLSPVDPPLNWSPSSDCCSWEGIKCDEGDGRVIKISLPSRGLSGDLPLSLMNLPSLSFLNLSFNSFSGSLSDEFFPSLRNLLVLDLSFNRLSGELPSYPDNSPNRISLQEVNLSGNSFNGLLNPLSTFLRAAWNLTSFNVSNNSFSGSVPSSICSLFSQGIKVLDFSYNRFNGSIPIGLGNCSKLWKLSAGFNSLSGSIPEDLYSIVSLVELWLPSNHLDGQISEAIGNLSSLKTLGLHSNNLTGPIPHGIGKLENLETLLLHINNLTGQLPQSLSNCKNLHELILRVNSLDGELSAFDFSSFHRLSILDLGNNRFTGILPPKLYSCSSLTAVRLASNNFSGEISPDIVGLTSLSFLSLSRNYLSNVTGALRVLMGCKSLTALILSTNFQNEELPHGIDAVGHGAFANIEIFALGGSQLVGQLPEWLIYLRNVQLLDLSVNQLRGAIPNWLGRFPKLFYLDLSNNALSGVFPAELGQMVALSTDPIEKANRSYLPLPVFAAPNNVTNQQYNQLASMPRTLSFENNSISGSIPPEIGQLKYLRMLNLSHNNFTGRIPYQLSNLSSLEKLDLSHNQLSGTIPQSLKNLNFLSQFSVADNNLTGNIPSGDQFDTFPSSSFEGNPGLCGEILSRSCSASTTGRVHSSKGNINTKAITAIVVGVCFGTGVLIAIIALLILSKKRIIPGGDNDRMEMETISHSSFSAFNGNIEKDVSMVIFFPNNPNEIKDLTLPELLNATGNFDQANIIGCGGYGLVYKAILADGTRLAVKKLAGDICLMDREFKAEVEALSTAHHKNLVSLRGYVIHDGIRMLVYSFMENGSLDYWLHEKQDGATQLDWPTRLRIACGASHGLAYMHMTCDPHIVHRDIKSSNILLDNNFEAHVADFGLARLILPCRTHVTTELVGTLGYIPPEYGQAWVATLRGDVYSFGVVLLELLTRRRPVEVFKPKSSRELVGWVQQMRSEGKADQVFDPLLRGKGFDTEMLQVLDVACLCVSQNQFKRPTIQEVVDLLNTVGSNREPIKS